MKGRVLLADIPPLAMSFRGAVLGEFSLVSKFLAWVCRIFGWTCSEVGGKGWVLPPKTDLKRSGDFHLIGSEGGEG